MTPDSFQLYLSRLKTIREGLTEPNRIKFIDDIFKALQYKDEIISKNHYEFYRIIQKTLKELEDTRYKLEGCALRYGIPVWEIEKRLRKTPEQAIREVKFWQKWKQECDELEGIKPEPVQKPRYASKPIGIPPNITIKPVGFSLKEIVNKIHF